MAKGACHKTSLATLTANFDVWDSRGERESTALGRHALAPTNTEQTNT